MRIEGWVEEVLTDSFLARMVDLEGRIAGESEGEILLSAVPEDDHSLVVPGAVFEWTDRIRFLRLPPITRTDLDRAMAEAKVTAERIGWT